MYRHILSCWVRRRLLPRASCALLMVVMVMPQMCAGVTVMLQAPVFKPLPNDRALVQNSVRGIVQDSSGFLWIATLGGLHRYDGLEMVLVNDLGTAQEKFNLLQVNAVAVAPNGDIWAGDAMSELSRINASNQSIDRFGSFSTRLRIEKETTIRQIKIQSSGVVWIKSDEALEKFDPITEKFERFKMSFPADWEGENGFGIELLDDDHLIIYNQNEFGILNLTDNTVTRMTDSLGNELQAGTVTSCSWLRDGSLWTCGSRGQIGKVALGSAGYQLELWQTPSNFGFTGLSMDLNDNIWLTVERWKVVRWCPVMNKLADVSIGLEHRATREMQSIRALFCDRSGVMWLGTDSLGLLYFDPSSARFGRIQQQSNLAGGFQDPYLWDIKEDEDGLIIAGRGELGRLSLDNGVYERIVDDSFQPDVGKNYSLFAVMPMGGRKLLLGFQSLGLGLYDEDTQSFELLDIYKNRHQANPGIGSPSGLEREKGGKIWAFFVNATWLLSADAMRREAIPSRLEAALQGRQVRAWAEHENGVLTFGTERHGLIQYDPRTDQVATWEHSEDPNSLPHNGVRGLCYDDKGNLWVGTYGGLGLLPAKRQPENVNPFYVFTTSDGLPNNTIYNILPGHDGTLWLATNVGLSHFDPQNLTFFNFDESDGIADNEFNGGAALLASNGLIYLGGINGLTWFDPAKMYTNRVAPIANILQVTTDLESNTSILGGIAIDQFHLPWDRSFIDLLLTATCFQQAEKQLAAYRIEGVLDRWRVAPRDETIRLANLPAGDHILTYRVSNNDGVWSPAKSIAIKVDSPPWLRSVAFLSYALVVMVISALAFLRRRQVQKVRAELNLQLATADKLAAVGQLAAGMAHDFNNQLQIIMGNAELLDMELPAGHPGKAHLKVISSTGRRAGLITSRLLTYAKESEPKREVLDLDQIVADLMDLVASFLGSRIELSFARSPGQKLVHANREQLEQVLVNLCLNSRDAIETQGKLEIRTSVDESDSNDRRCLCEVSDDGCGVPDDLKTRIFEPFFSSKEVGTGLGLSMVKRIITQHGGTIGVSDNELGGATFCIDLPAVAPPLATQQKPAVPDQATEVVEESVLVADDDASVNKLTTKILTRAGYRVISVKNGEEGIAALREHPEIRLAVLDVMMPILDGRAVYDFIIAEKLGISVIFCTGFSFSALEGSELKEVEALVLAKPFTSTELLAMVRQVGLPPVKTQDKGL